MIKVFILIMLIIMSNSLAIAQQCGIPQNIAIENDSDTIQISWDAVIADVNGDPITPDFYNIYRSDTSPDGSYELIGTTTNTFYTLTDSPSVVDKAFIKITAEKETTGNIDPDFVFVEGGTFHNDTANVTISDFYMCKYEVTQAEYEAVMGSNPSYFSGSDKPVERVSWFDAIKYCNLLSLQEGLIPCYNYDNEGTDPNEWSSGWNNNSNQTNYYFDTNANGYRLPTEMEWMYAAKGGNQEPASGYNQYAGTNVEAQLSNYAWYAANNGSWGTPEYGSKEVATKLPNQLGLYDMSGNVWEWCWDIEGDYFSSAQSDPVGPAMGSRRVIRGGSWAGSAAGCRVARRNDFSPANSHYTLGFRLARSSN